MKNCGLKIKWELTANVKLIKEALARAEDT